MRGKEWLPRGQNPRPRISPASIRLRMLLVFASTDATSKTVVKPTSQNLLKRLRQLRPALLVRAKTSLEEDAHVVHRPAVTLNPAQSSQYLRSPGNHTRTRYR